MNWIDYSERKPSPEPRRQVWIQWIDGFYDSMWTDDFTADCVVKWAEIEELDRRYPVSPTWPHVMEFAQRMEGKLARNRHKGDREGWLGCDVRNLIAALKTELNEMEAEALAGNAEAAANECADVANFALMIADWYLTHAQLPPSSPPPDPCEEWWKSLSPEDTTHITKYTMARWGWDAAIKWKEKQ